MTYQPNPHFRLLCFAIIIQLLIPLPKAFSQTPTLAGYELYKTTDKASTAMWFQVMMFSTDSGEIQKAYFCKENILAKSYKGLLHIPGSIKTEFGAVIPVEGVIMGGCSDCDELDSVYIEYGIKNIIHEAFSGCINLRGIRLPPSLENIGMKAFEGCTSLRWIELPQHLHTIQAEAFAGCCNIRYCKVNWHKPIDIGSSVFKGCQLSGCTLVVPRGTRQLYEQAEGWKDFGRIIEE